MLCCRYKEVFELTNTDELIEAVEYAQESGEDWWDLFDCIRDAEKILNGAAKENPDEYQVAQLAELLDEDIFDNGPATAYRNCIKQLKKQLRQA